MKIKSISPYVVILALSLLIPLLAVMTVAQTDTTDVQTGLIGILYDDSDFKRPVSVWPISSLSSAELDWPENNDFSARWQGKIKGPHDGTITFFSESDNGLRLEINETVVLDAWAAVPTDKGSIEMKVGETYSIIVEYRQISGTSSMRLAWSWPWKEREVIPATALTYSTEDRDQVQENLRQELELPAEELAFNISAILTVNNLADVQNKRQAFNNLIFGPDGLPLQAGIDQVEENIIDKDFTDLPNLKQIDKLTMTMEFGLNSIAYHFIPLTSNNRAVIYHQGHLGKFSRGISTISGLLAKGYQVVALSMPLKGMNSQPVVYLERFGTMFLNTHERMRFLEPEQGHPLRYFIEPVIRVVNYLQTKGFSRIDMTGISGGGWTTTLCAAMDIRISYSYPVAGSLPLYLRIRDAKNGSWGDYEQVAPEVYRIVNYLELYVLGASGDGRRQIQMLNEFDSCCFSGTGYKSYRLLVQERVKSIGNGSFDVFLDSSHQDHKISEIALEYILNDLEKI